MTTAYYAIIDIGSNTMRLVIYAKDQSLRLQEVENVKSVARLRNYLDDDQKLNNEGIRKLISTLQSFKKVTDTYNLRDLACTATATVRQAKNKDMIAKTVKEEIGWEMRILSEEEEAYYGYLAVVNSTSIEEGYTVDIGGGSTEITYFKDRKLIHSHSFPFGALTLKEFFTGENYEQDVKKLNNFLEDHFTSLDWLVPRDIPLIGIGGSARNIAQIDQNRKSYPLAGLHQYQMTSSDIGKIISYLSDLDKDELEKVEGLSKDRADTILPASFVFYTLYELLDAESFTLSRKGLRDGVFYEYLAKDEKTEIFPNVLKDSVTELIHEYNLNPRQIAHITELSRKLFKGFQSRGLGNLEKEDWQVLERACYVYNLGEYIDSESSPQHTFYLMANRTIDGLSHIERLKMALVASFKNKTVFKQFIDPFKDWFLKDERKRLILLGSMVKFIYCLDATKRQIVDDFELTVKDNTLRFDIFCNDDYKPEQYQAEKQKKHLEKALKMDIELKFTENHSNNA